MPLGEDDFCSLPILVHEPYNVKESWHVWNYTSILLREVLREALIEPVLPAR